jgi:hypothetical protein
MTLDRVWRAAEAIGKVARTKIGIILCCKFFQRSTKGEV